MPSFDGSRDLDRSVGFPTAFDGADRTGHRAGSVIAVHACSRIGMTANPPRGLFSDLFRRRATR